MVNEEIDRFLKDVLVVTTRKSFWASPECEEFPNRIYTKILFGHSGNIVNTLLLTLRVFITCWIHKPKLILFGSAPRIVPLFILLKKFGLLPQIKFITTTQINFNDAMASYVDSIIVYSQGQIELHNTEIKDKYKFIHLPTDGLFNLYNSIEQKDYIFSGGGDGRDFQSVIEAVKGLDVQLIIVTFTPKKLEYKGELPENCKVLWRMPPYNFLKLMAGSLFVVVPLIKGLKPHGHTTIVQALSLGKAVLTTKNASIDDYVKDQQEGLLVSPGDVAGYRKAILKLLNQPDFRKSCENKAIVKSRDLTYKVFLQRIVDLCYSILVS